VIVIKRLRAFVKGQFWWGCYQNACTKTSVHPLTANGMPTNFDLEQSSVGGDARGGEALAMGEAGVICRGGKPC
jgi:hypothetical protein